MLALTANVAVRRSLGAVCYLGALVLAFGAGDVWTQASLVLASFTVGYVSGRWWSLTLAVLVVPAVVVTFSRVGYDGDLLSWRLDAALFAMFYGVPPVALLIGLGVTSRRVVRRGLQRARRAAPTPS